MKTWIDKNPSWLYLMWCVLTKVLHNCSTAAAEDTLVVSRSDADIEAFMEKFASHEAHKMFHEFLHNVERTDLWRWM